MLLAGRFSTEELYDENAKWIYLDCTKGPGSRLVHATLNMNVSVILSSIDVHPIVRSFFDLGEKSINYDGHNRPLLSIQVTELIDGIFIGFTMNHSLVDGNSQWHFINSFSEIFLQLSQSQGNDTIHITRKPVFDSYFPDGWGPVLKLPNIGIKRSVPKSVDPVVLRDRIFHFSSESISLIKAQTNKECGVHNISSFQALSGLMWRSITRARNLQAEHETSCGLAINARPRFSPPLTNNYFGNLSIRQQSICNVGELLNKGFGWAAMLLHQIVVSQDDKKVHEFYEIIVKLLCGPPNDPGMGNPFYSPNFVMIGGSTRFDMYGPEFGLGKAQAVLAGYCNKEDGKITPSLGREGDGSVDFEVCLKPETMNALELDEEFIGIVELK
ncbi:hypothetical protein RND81_14G239100 [Saponaria officinalis]|uniref:Uncharacterized protein n=1 Tax=Saponaria officinalis TaxID=3572 RepID=A0AAW1GW78_SAPOF